SALRLARFNVALEDPDQPSWMARFFVGVPAPAAALVALLPLYFSLLQVPDLPGSAVFTLIYTAVIAVLMVSRLPTFSAKMLGQRVRRDMVMPGLVVFAVFAAVLASYTWMTLAVGSLLYLAAIPVAFTRHRQYASGRRVSAEPAPEKSKAETKTKTKKN
ncbi:CDP-diacylglycerol--serine O-phosphatidyltransferase, partial [hydrothermal vent metagenome]